MKIIIVGGGAAAISVADNLIKNNKNNDLQISMICREAEYPYYRPFLSKTCGLNVPISNFYLKPVEWYTKNNIDIKLNTKIIEIDEKNKCILGEDKKHYYYDKLVIATGSHGFKLPNIDYNTKGIFQLNEYSDVLKVTKYINDNNCKNAIVIGGGILGCESAYAMTRFNCKITIIEMMPHLLPRMLSKSSSNYLQEIIKKFNIDIITNDVSSSIEKNKENKFVVKLKSGKIIEGDLIIVNVGVRPNIDYLKNTSIKVNRGIICNEYLQTSTSDIYVAGDILEFPGKMTIMLWEPALLQGEIIANNILNPQSLMKYNFNKQFVVTYNSFNTVLNCFGDVSKINENSQEIIVKRNINENKIGYTFINYFGNEVIFCASFNDPKSSSLIRTLSNSNSYDKEIFKDFIKDNIKR